MNKIELPKIKFHCKYTLDDLKELRSKILSLFNSTDVKVDHIDLLAVLKVNFNTEMGIEWSDVSDWYQLYDKYLRANTFSFALNVRLENEYEYLVWDQDIILTSVFVSDRKHEFVKMYRNLSKKETLIPLCEIDRLKSLYCKKSSEVLLIRCMNGQWYDSDIVRFRYDSDNMPKGSISRKSFNSVICEASKIFDFNGIEHSNEKLEKLLESFIINDCSNQII